MPRTTRRRTRRNPAAESLTETAYRAIKSEILSNRLPAGSLVPIERFVREMRLSRTPVREAILQLQREGLIEIRPRLGTYVAQFDLGRIQEMYHVRGILEASAARLAAELADPERLAEVEARLRAQRVDGPIDIVALSEAGYALHKLIVDSCGNGVLQATINGLQDHFTRFRHLSMRLPEKVLASHREHLAIAGALKRGDGDNAESLMRAHFDHAARALVESLVSGRERTALAGVAVPVQGR